MNAAPPLVGVYKVGLRRTALLCSGRRHRPDNYLSLILFLSLYTHDHRTPNKATVL